MEWLRGCAALPDVIPSERVMDTDCASKAFEYCAIGRAEEERPTCYAALSDALAGDLSALRSAVRVPDGGSPFKKGRVVRFIEGGRVIEPMDCGENFEGISCSAMQGLSAWIELRSLVRASGGNPDAVIFGEGQ